MMRTKTKKVVGVVFAVVLVAAIGLYFGIGWAIDRALQTDPFELVYADNCATCHGNAYEGTSIGPALIGVPLQHGTSIAAIAASVSHGFPEQGMPGWEGVLDPATIQSLAILIAERRQNISFTEFHQTTQFELPSEPIQSELHEFKMELVVDGLDPLPFSIAPLPDGDILVTEKQRGMRVVSANGEISELISDMPLAFGDGLELGALDYGVGFFLDVAPHPNYLDNGWIYLHYTQRCEVDCDATDSLIPSSMNRVIRGRIDDGRWIDQEVVWEVAPSFATPVPDIGAGGRLAFDHEGYLYISIGLKGGYYQGVQDLSTPYGKILRVRDDGAIPTDNPFVDTPGAMQSIWTYGHRSPQGLEFDNLTGELWGTEMGPRGGDELNHLYPGRNFGWPLYSKGLNYDGTPVDYGKVLGIEFDLEDIEQPIVDFTPSPAISSFAIYEGAAFPKWQRNFIVGSLRARQLYRIELDGDKATHIETLYEELARIRDVEVANDGSILLLLEHQTGGKIVRLEPTVEPSTDLRTVVASPADTLRLR